MKIKLLCLLLSLVLSFSLVACNGGGGEGGENNENGGEEKETVTHTVTVDVLGARALGGVRLLVYDAEGNLKRIAETDYRGQAQFKAPKEAGYTVSVAELEGYLAEDSYPLTADTRISLTPALIADTSLDGVRYELGSTMRDFTVTTVDGNTFTLSEVLANKKGVFVNLFFTNCGPCKSEMPDIQAAYEAYGDDIAFIAIDPAYVDDDEEDVKAFRDTFALTFDVAYAETDALAEAFAVYSYPTSVFIDRYGTVCLIQRGRFMAEDVAALEAVLEHLAADDYEQRIFKSLDDAPTP